MPALSKYNPEYHDDWAWSLAIKGATNDEIAEAFWHLDAAPLFAGSRSMRA